MPNINNAVKCVCPFYISESGKSIHCEGMIRGSTTRCVFESEERKREHQAVACQTNEYARRCLLAKALEVKYQKTKKHQPDG